MIVLDTHIWVWWVHGDPSLPPPGRTLLDASEQTDLGFQKTRFAPDFFEFGRSGRIYQRDEVVRTDSAPILAQLPLENLRFRVLDVNTAQLTYNSAVEYEGGVEYARRSSLWSRGPAGWVMRFHQGTPYFP